MINLKGFAVTSTLYDGVNTRVVRAVTIDTNAPVIIKTPADPADTFSHAKPVIRAYNRPDIPIRYAPYTRLKQWLLRKVMT